MPHPSMVSEILRKGFTRLHMESMETLSSPSIELPLPMPHEAKEDLVLDEIIGEFVHNEEEEEHMKSKP